jgi:hypothetical protein
MEPAHPGEILMPEFLKPLELSQNQLAKELSVPARRINEIVHGKPPHYGGHRRAANALFRNLGRVSG